MFNKDNKRKNKTTHIDTLIGQHTHIKGDISFSGGLRIDGEVTGNISVSMDTSESMLTLSEKSRVSGEISAPNLIINGTIIGDVRSSQHVELAPKAKIKGNVYYRFLEMAMGCEINGQLIHVEDDAQIDNREHVISDSSDASLQLGGKR